MKIKSGCEASSSDPWYDISSGGYLNPDDICDSKDDAKRVKAAVAVVKDFFDSCEAQIEDFVQ